MLFSDNVYSVYTFSNSYTFVHYKYKVYMYTTYIFVYYKLLHINSIGTVYRTQCNVYTLQYHSIYNILCTFIMYKYCLLRIEPISDISGESRIDILI